MDFKIMQAVVEAAPERRPACVLIVEDEFLVRMTASDALRDAGYHVLEAMSGDEAVEILASGVSVDLIFSDVRMPGSLDGLGLLGHVQAAFPGLPFIMTSGHLQPGLADVDRASRFLAKPYRLEQVFQMIENELANAR